jgi:hypothetical protein
VVTVTIASPSAAVGRPAPTRSTPGGGLNIGLIRIKAKGRSLAAAPFFFSQMPGAYWCPPCIISCRVVWLYPAGIENSFASTGLVLMDFKVSVSVSMLRLR